MDDPDRVATMTHPLWSLPRGSKDALAELLGNLGLLRVLEGGARRNCLVGLCYHRIGHPDHSAYDPALFSATPEQFDQQVKYLKARFHVAELEEVLGFLDRPSTLRGPNVVITFDDGYADNSHVAADILASHGVQGTFFLPTSFIDTTRLPWWDQVAWLLRKTTVTTIEIDYPKRATFAISAATLKPTLRAVLALYKSPETQDTDRFMRELERACGLHVPQHAETPQFMTWDEAARMQGKGMAFGSHTHRHHLLGKLSVDDQLAELVVSRNILQERLSISADVLAYPVGSRTSFSRETAAALTQAGYRAAFSFYGGVNLPGHLQRFNLLRLPVWSDMRLSRFRLETATQLMFGQVE